MSWQRSAARPQQMGGHVAQEKVAHDAPMSRLVKQSPHRRSLVPVELPPIDADRAAELHEVRTA